jgi:hypothetical protein
VPDEQPDVNSEEFKLRMQDVGKIFRAAGIKVIYLVHGTFAGDDPAGLLSELSRRMPTTGYRLRSFIKRMIDALVGSHGNYTDDYADLFQEALNAGQEPAIEVHRFCWSGENHHLGRANAAVQLLAEMSEREQQGATMLWGHSHAGNVFALMTSLLAGDPELIDAFFRAAKPYWSTLPRKGREGSAWNVMFERLSPRDKALFTRPPHFCTFGTPIRYGWESTGYKSLLHFVNHRRVPELPDYRADFPKSAGDIQTAAGGDYVQQLGIAGTNTMPSIFTPRALRADRRLNKKLQERGAIWRLRERLKMGMRVPEEGTTLLVDYGEPAGMLPEHLAGHAVYTEPAWLLFHAEQSAAHLQD